MSWGCFISMLMTRSLGRGAGEAFCVVRVRREVWMGVVEMGVVETRV